MSYLLKSLAASLPCAIFTTAAVVLELHNHHWAAGGFGFLVLFVIPTIRFRVTSDET